MRVLLVCWGTFGEIRPYIWLARRLGLAGHEVTLAAPAIFDAIFRPLVARCVSLPPDLADGQGEGSGQVRRLFNPRHGMERLLGEVIDPGVEEQRQVFSALLGEARAEGKPFARAFVSWIAPGAFLACREAGLSTVQNHLNPQSLFLEKDPPLFTRWRRVTSGQGRLDQQSLRMALHRHGVLVMPRLAELQAAAGWPEESRGPFPLSVSWPRLAFFPQSFLRAPAAGVAHLANHWASRPYEMAGPVRRFLSEGPAPVLVSLGSVSAGDEGRLLKTIAGAVESLGERAIVSMGLSKRGHFRSTPSQLFVGNLWPAQVLSQVKAVVHHGGMNSLQETLAFGRPALVLPQAFDQLDAACRLEWLGLGLFLPPGRQSAPDIRKRLGALLADEGIASRAALWAVEQRVEQGLSVEEALVLT
jgi:hypothetical protein